MADISKLVMTLKETQADFLKPLYTKRDKLTADLAEVNGEIEEAEAALAKAFGALPAKPGKANGTRHRRTKEEMEAETKAITALLPDVEKQIMAALKDKDLKDTDGWVRSPDIKDHVRATIKSEYADAAIVQGIRDMANRGDIKSNEARGAGLAYKKPK